MYPPQSGAKVTGVSSMSGVFLFSRSNQKTVTYKIPYYSFTQEVNYLNLTVGNFNLADGGVTVVLYGPLAR